MIVCLTDVNEQSLDPLILVITTLILYKLFQILSVPVSNFNSMYNPIVISSVPRHTQSGAGEDPVCSISSKCKGLDIIWQATSPRPHNYCTDGDVSS